MPASELSHVIDGLLSIHHVAVSAALSAVASRIIAEHDGKRLSEHDVYVVDVSLEQ